MGNDKNSVLSGEITCVLIPRACRKKMLSVSILSLLVLIFVYVYLGWIKYFINEGKQTKGLVTTNLKVLLNVAMVKFLFVINKSVVGPFGIYTEIKMFCTFKWGSETLLQKWQLKSSGCANQDMHLQGCNYLQTLIF